RVPAARELLTVSLHDALPILVGLVVDAVDAEGVGDLHGGVDVDVGDVGDHAAEESDVDGVAGVRELLGPRLVFLGPEERGDVAGAVDGEAGPAVELAGGGEDQGLALGGGYGSAVLLRLGGRPVGDVGLETRRLDRLVGQCQGRFRCEGRVESGDAVGEEFDDLLGPHAEFGRVEQVLVPEVGTDGALPRLAGDPGAGNAAVD